MIGNDLIDLNLALKNRKADNPRFLNKIFTGDEIDQIHSSPNPEILIWQFWSLKETAYKAHQRKFDLPRKFNPSKFSCKLESKNKFQVNRGNLFYKCFSEVTSNYIHTYTFSEEMVSKVYFNNTYSQKDLFAKISESLELSESDFDIHKNNENMPYIYFKTEEKSIPFSLSHHGNYTGFLIPLIKS